MAQHLLHTSGHRALADCSGWVRTAAHQSIMTNVAQDVTGSICCLHNTNKLYSTSTSNCVMQTMNTCLEVAVLYSGVAFGILTMSLFISITAVGVLCCRTR
jgi:hypothetical protein